MAKAQCQPPDTSCETQKRGDRGETRRLGALQSPSYFYYCSYYSTCEAKAAFDEAQKELDAAEEVACDKEAEH